MIECGINKGYNIMKWVLVKEINYFFKNSELRKFRPKSRAGYLKIINFFENLSLPFFRKSGVIRYIIIY